MPNPPHKSTAGAIDGVPCPWCDFKNDFRQEAGEDEGGATSSWGSSGLEKGARFSCDNPQCGRFFRILAIQKITVIKLVPSN